MTLRELIKMIPIENRAEIQCGQTACNRALDKNISGLSLNSKTIKRGEVFFCLSGTHCNGILFARQAQQKGAAAIIIEKGQAGTLPKNLIVIAVEEIISCLGALASSFYGNPCQNLTLIGVTGTNGKTTVTYIIENILRSYGKPAGVIGTINYRFNHTLCFAPNTTPDTLTVHNLFSEMVKKNVRYAVMEVSSHALAQRRIEGILFDAVILTNVSQDHLDYHHSRQEYFLAKSKLFTRHLKKGAAAIINTDDEYGRQLVEMVRRQSANPILTYGIDHKADVTATDTLFRRNGTAATIKTPDNTFDVTTNLVGEFNLYNILAAASACISLHIPTGPIRSGLKNVFVPGRLEQVPTKSGLRVFIDYAHTEDALRNVLATLSAIKEKGRLIVVFGCGGERDITKRPKMGAVASQLADYVVVTSDNPRGENPQKIIADIEKGIATKNYSSISNRRAAIKKAVALASADDILLVAGKGHEQCQIIKKRKLPFNDRKIVEEFLADKGLISRLRRRPRHRREMRRESCLAGCH